MKTIAELKAEISQKVSFPVEQIKLVSKGKMLKNQASFESLGKSDELALHAIFLEKKLTKLEETLLSIKKTTQ